MLKLNILVLGSRDSVINRCSYEVVDETKDTLILKDPEKDFNAEFPKSLLRNKVSKSRPAVVYYLEDTHDQEVQIARLKKLIAEAEEVYENHLRTIEHHKEISLVLEDKINAAKLQLQELMEEV